MINMDVSNELIHYLVFFGKESGFLLFVNPNLLVTRKQLSESKTKFSRQNFFQQDFPFFNNLNCSVN